jgi:hypothetical protein
MEALLASVEGRTSLTHGLQDSVHGSSRGEPWRAEVVADVCLTYDLTAAAYLAVLLLRRIRNPHAPE